MMLGRNPPKFTEVRISTSVNRMLEALAQNRHLGHPARCFRPRIRRWVPNFRDLPSAELTLSLVLEGGERVIFQGSPG